MWHEARSRNKANLKLMREHKRLVEKRRNQDQTHDKTRLLLVNGIKAPLLFDPNGCRQSNQALVPWQGDPNIKIDRFDVRATLSSMPNNQAIRKSNHRTSNQQQQQTKQKQTVLDSDSSEIKKKLLNFERYRLLIYNDLRKISEETRLKMLSVKDSLSQADYRRLENDRFGTSGEASNRDDKPRYANSQRSELKQRGSAAISYDYCVPPSSEPEIEQTNNPPKAPDLMDSVCSDLDDIDLAFVEGSKRLDNIAQRFGLTGDDFILILKAEKRGLNTQHIIDDLTCLNAKTTQKRDETEQVYGPPLPPEFMTTCPDEKPPCVEPTATEVDERIPDVIDVPPPQSDNIVRNTTSTRRASTPLAYKRNRRSSRSVSRERAKYRRQSSRRRSRCTDSCSSRHSPASSCSSHSRSHSLSSVSSTNSTSQSECSYRRSRRRKKTRRYSRPRRRGSKSRSSKRS